MSPNDDATTNNYVFEHSFQPGAAGHADEHIEIHYAGLRWGLSGDALVDADEDEPYGRINPEALSFHPERLALLDEPDEDVPVAPEAWFIEERNGFDMAHCITLLDQVGVDDVFSRLKAKQQTGTSSFADFLEDASLQLEDDDHALVGVANLGRWSLLIESNGFVATRPERKKALSRGTTTVTLYAGINSSSEYSVNVDGEEQLSFDWLFPAGHRGSRSGAFIERMLAAGLVFEEDDDRSENEAAALTFVENLTSVRLTVGLLDGLTLRTGLIENY